MISTILVVIIAVMQLMFGGMMAASVAFLDTTMPISTLAMMALLGSIFHSVLLIASIKFPSKVRKTILLLLLVWHIPEAGLIQMYGMGVPPAQQMMGSGIHVVISMLALLAWYFTKDKTESKLQNN